VGRPTAPRGLSAPHRNGQGRFLARRRRHLKGALVPQPVMPTIDSGRSVSSRWGSGSSPIRGALARPPFSRRGQDGRSGDHHSLELCGPWQAKSPLDLDGTREIGLDGTMHGVSKNNPFLRVPPKASSTGERLRVAGRGALESARPAVISISPSSAAASTVFKPSATDSLIWKYRFTPSEGRGLAATSKSARPGRFA